MSENQPDIKSIPEPETPPLAAGPGAMGLTTEEELRTESEYAEKLRERYGKLSSEKREEEFKENLKKVRELLALLERRSEPWMIGRGLITQPEGELEFILENVLRVLAEIEGKEAKPLFTLKDYEKIRLEAEGREWLHTAKLYAIKGSSPTDIARFVEAVQDFDDIRLLRGITSIPGFEVAFRGLERRGEDIIKFENDPKEYTQIMEEIKQEISKAIQEEAQAQGKTVEDILLGTTPEQILEVARRFWKVQGREGYYYKRHMEMGSRVRYGKTKKDDSDLMREGANLSWDVFRVLYYPHAIWHFFGVGGDEEGERRKVVVPSQRFFGGPEQKTVEVEIGKGLGRRVRKTLLEYGLDFDLQDWFSRRKNYLLQAWRSWKEKTQPEDLDIPKPPHLAGISDEDWKEHPVYQELLKIKFAKEVGVPAWDIKTEEGKSYARTEEVDILPEGEKFFPSLANIKLSQIPFEYLQRAHENVRAQVRDHKAALTVLGGVWNFISKPTPGNFFKIPISQVTAYTGLEEAQDKIFRPLYIALRDVLRGPLFGGYELPPWKSLAGKIFNWKSLNDYDLRRIAEEAISTGQLSKDLVWKIHGGFLGWVKEMVLLKYADPMILGAVFMAILVSQIEQLTKEVAQQ